MEHSEEVSFPPLGPISADTTHRIRLSRLPLQASETSISGSSSASSVKITDEPATPVQPHERGKHEVTLHVRYTIVRECILLFLLFWDISLILLCCQQSSTTADLS